MASSALRIASLVAVIASLGVLLGHHLPRTVQARIDGARARHDAWAGYLAPESACPGRTRTDASPLDQDRTMVCLLSYARAHAGFRPLPVIYLLNRSSLLKAIDIVRCRDFSHTACGKPFRAEFEAVGYQGATTTAVGENIAWGDGPAGSPLVVVDGWLNSPHHRENLLSAAWGEQGVAVMPVSEFLGKKQAEVWVNQFGARS